MLWGAECPTTPLKVISPAAFTIAAKDEQTGYSTGEAYTNAELKDMSQVTLPEHRKFSWLGWLGGVAILAGGSWWAYDHWFSDRASSITVQINTVTQGTVEDPITQTGIIKLAQQRPLKSLAEGRVKEVYVALGDRITTGQILLLLDDDRWQTEQLRHSLNVQQHDIALKTTTSGDRHR